MRTHSTLLIFVTLFLIGGFVPATSAQSPSNTQFEAAGTDAARVQAFLVNLKDALAVENQLRVASLVKYPLEAWVDGQAIKIRNDSELLSRYRQIFDPSMRQLIAGARVEALTVSADGVMLDARLCFKAPQKGKALKIVKIGEPVANK